MKNKKALDNIRNTQLGHILIDYRICCAMLNFNMKTCNPDGNDSIKIAKTIRKRSLITENKLDSLLKIRFTSTLVSIDIQSIEDFPKLTLRQLKNIITLGSFKLRQCRSYLDQLINHGKLHLLNHHMIEKYVTDPEVIQDLKFSKLIAVQIPSRHKRGKKNKEANDFDPKGFTTLKQSLN